ncbi:MAG: DMT family transporter [Pseudorhodobacter sp.]
MAYGLGVVLVVTAAVLWSTMGLVIRQIGEAGTWAILFWRSAGMVPVLLAFVAWRNSGDLISPLRRVGWPGVVGGFGLVAAFAGAIYAFQVTTIANAVFLFAVSPFIAAALGFLLLGESVRRATWVAIALASVGIFVMVREGLSMGALAGNVAALLSAFGFAAFTLSLRWGKLNDMLPAIALGGVMSMVAAALVLTMQPGTLAVPPRDIAISMGMGAGLLAVGMMLYTLGSKVIPAAELTLLTMVEVMLAPVWVWALMGETASSGTLTGGAILMAAVAFNALSGMRRRPLAPPIR